MIEVYTNLHVGDDSDYELSSRGAEGWAIVHACKEPYHRQALGYRTRGAPKDHPEYLVARRGNRLILNMVDANDPAFFHKEMIDAALDFIDECLGEGLQVLVHCNEGMSRSASIALLYLAARAGALPAGSLEEAEVKFRQIYPQYHPKPGIRGHLEQYWHAYCTHMPQAM